MKNNKIRAVLIWQFYVILMVRCRKGCASGDRTCGQGEADFGSSGGSGGFVYYPGGAEQPERAVAEDEKGAGKAGEAD